MRPHLRHRSEFVVSQPIDPDALLFGILGHLAEIARLEGFGLTGVAARAIFREETFSSLHGA